MDLLSYILKNLLFRDPEITISNWILLVLIFISLLLISLLNQFQFFNR